ncbi:hypothetical protein [Parafilimonas sp.]|uniref:hypothetical protein n=1 Tax=Parafilimonas sp. TaxID=1969739 RepID=UPI0039E47D51
MQYKIVHIYPSDDFLNDDNTLISFKKFVDFLHEKLKEGDSLKSKFFRFVLRHFKRYPELLKPFSIYDLKNYSQVFTLLEGVIVPNLVNEKAYALSLGVPLNPVFFLQTTAFNDLVQNRLSDITSVDDNKERKELIRYRRRKVAYDLILERLYNFEPLVKEELVHTRTDTATNLTKYFTLNIDNRFVDVACTGPLPQININLVQQQLANAGTIEEVEKILPLKQFSFSGFSVVTASDTTAKYALHKIRSAIIKHTPGDYIETYTAIIDLLRQMCGKEGITFGLLPFLKLNGRLVSYYSNYKHSVIINICNQLAISEKAFLEWINSYFENPRTLIKKNCSIETRGADAVYKAFAQSGYNGYAIVPVFYNNEVAGVLEVSVKDTALLNEILFTQIDAALPVLGQLMHQSQTEFATSITSVITNNFTTIQPSVLWKFNQVSWEYLKNTDADSMKKMEEIRFDNLHPLYGAVDIRNSTIERNNALHKDMRYYFKMVKSFLKELQVQDAAKVHALTEEANNFLDLTESSFTGNEEALIDGFMENLNTCLKEVEASPGTHNTNLINTYYRDIDLKHGKAYKNRRVLENSMQCINFIISEHFTKMQEDLQKKYPVYFEKIRTDGIEYDIYIGQSISPEKPYQKTYLSALRYLQLENMAAVAKLVYASAQSLPVHLQTTQLIYVNASSITLTFRMDEKRFDVEGGYNVRYHIIKKRIDKVLIKQTGERLTQPGRLAIIYTQPRHEKEYLDYIKKLQDKNMLLQDIELLELEQLQGVQGLKAIRVGVNFEN